MQKKLITLALLFSVLLNSQYKKASFEIGVGGHVIADQCAVLDDNYNHFNGTIRYNLNPVFGLGLYVGHDNLSFLSGTDTRYQRVSLEGVVKLNTIVGLKSKNLVLLAHGGGGISRFDSGNTRINPDNMLNLSGGLTSLLRIGNHLALKTDVSTVGNIRQDNTLDYRHITTNSGINSTITNFSVGLVAYLGKGKRHADFYDEPDKVDTFVLKPTIIERTVIEKPVPLVVPNKRNCDCDYIDFVYFDFDKHNIERSELSSIEKAADKLTSNRKIVLTGWACPVFGSIEYNSRLAEKRVNAVKAKLISIGISENDIKTVVKGKDFRRSSKEARPLARRVDIEVIKY